MKLLSPKKKSIAHGLGQCLRSMWVGGRTLFFLGLLGFIGLECHRFVQAGSVGWYSWWKCRGSKISFAGCLAAIVSFCRPLWNMKSLGRRLTLLARFHCVVSWQAMPWSCFRTNGNMNHQQRRRDLNLWSLCEVNGLNFCFCDLWRYIRQNLQLSWTNVGPG